MYKTVYLIWARKLDQHCVKGRQASNLASDLKNQINIRIAIVKTPLIYNKCMMTLTKLGKQKEILHFFDSTSDTKSVESVPKK